MNVAEGEVILEVSDETKASEPKVKPKRTRGHFARQVEQEPQSRHNIQSVLRIHHPKRPCVH